MRALTLVLILYATVVPNTFAKRAKYKYRFLAVNELNSKEFTGELDEFERNKLNMITNLQKKYQLFKGQKLVHLTLENLYTALDGFKADNCLLVLDNWQNVDIKQNSALPSMLRYLEIAFSHRKLRQKREYTQYVDDVLLPKKPSFKNASFRIHNLIKNQYHACPISSFYYPLTVNQINDAFCVDLVHESFLLKSKPWNCEIQVSLSMPEHLLKSNNFPGLFRYNYDFKFNYMPSTRPKIHMFVDFKNAQDIDSVSLLNWLKNSKHHERKWEHRVFKINYSSQNTVHFTGQIDCNMKRSIYLSEPICNVLDFNYINLCADCPYYMVSIPLNHNIPSFEYFATVEKSRRNKFWYGGFMDNNGYETLTLTEQINTFVDNEREAMMTPLKNLPKMTSKYPDHIQVLGFAFGSVLKHLLGNVTDTTDEFDAISKEKRQWHILWRAIVLDESLFDDKNVVLSFHNKFGSLRFVSCGSRGYETLQIDQFVSVFEKPVWIGILIVAVLLIVAMNLLRGSLCVLISVENASCFIKVLLEQGDPFPGKFVKSKPFRFVICGTLLGGVVLSNAFKSTNVYNIVLPKQLLNFRTIEELLEYGYTVFTKIIQVVYVVDNLDYMFQSARAVVAIAPENSNKVLDIITEDGNLTGFGLNQIHSYYYQMERAPEQLNRDDKNSIMFLLNSTWPHTGLHDIFVEPLNAIRPLIQIGLTEMKYVRFFSGATSYEFLKKQYQFIVDDLMKCNKTAWILPDYQAQQLNRDLYRSQKHSDVGVSNYCKLNFIYYFRGALPQPLIIRASMISSTGLLEWWSNLINRTDLVWRRQNEPPVKPTMTGNIQIIFLILAVGISLANMTMIVELHGYIFRVLKAAYCLFRFVLLRIVKELSSIGSTIRQKTRFNRFIQ